MTRRFTLDDMDREEHLPIVASFADELDIGETITGATISVEVESGVDATPSAGLDGAMLVTNDAVTQRFHGRIPGNVYAVRFRATTSTGNVRVRIAVQRVV